MDLIIPDSVLRLGRWNNVINFDLFENQMNRLRISTKRRRKMCIKINRKFFLVDKIIFNIVMGNLFPGTY